MGAQHVLLHIRGKSLYRQINTFKAISLHNLMNQVDLINGNLQETHMNANVGILRKLSVNYTDDDLLLNKS